jgi:hypothetical protein
MTDRPYRSNKTVRHVVFKHFIELASATYSKDALPVDSMIVVVSIEGSYRATETSFQNKDGTRPHPCGRHLLQSSETIT